MPKILQIGGGSTGSSSTATDHIYFGSTTLGVTNLKVVSGVEQVALSAGNQDLYTCPVGKKALAVGATVSNNSGNTITCLVQVKVSGVYTAYDFASNALATGSFGGTAAPALIPMLLNAGESWATNCDNAGLAIWPFILEFDSTASIARTMLTTLASGDNTLLTVPSNGIQFMPFFQNGSSNVVWGRLFYFNNSGVNRTIHWNLIPSGGSVGASNQITAATSVSSPNATVGLGTVYGGLNSGDVVSVNTDANTAGQEAHVIYRLLP